MMNTSAKKSFVICGPQQNSNIPKASIGKIIYDCLRKRNGSEVISIDAVTGDTLTCERFLEQSIKITSVLKSCSIKKNDVIAIICENSLNCFVPIVGAFYMGVAVSLLNSDYSAGELKHALSLTLPKLILCSAKALKMVLAVKTEFPEIQSVLLIGQPSEYSFGIEHVEELVEKSAANSEHFELAEFDTTQQTAFILLSSGTTGLSKGVLTTHDNLRQMLGNISCFSVSNEDTTILLAPFFHILGSFINMLSLVYGIKMVIMEEFKPDVFLQSLQKHKVTKLFVVPTLLNFLAKSPLTDSYDLSTLKDIFSGGAPLGAEMEKAIEEKFPQMQVYQMYGSTETTGACTIMPKNVNKSGSVGVLVPNILAKVWNSDAKEILSPFKIGELCFKGPLIMKGYLGNSSATLECFDEEGFFHTGDAGYYDEDGFFYVVDRLKELIKYKAFQVPPAELEALLLTHPAVSDCGVIGIPDERAGELPLAVVVRQQNANVTEKELVDFVAERISVAKHLHGGVKFVEEIPKNKSGKVLRSKLKTMYTNL